MVDIIAGVIAVGLMLGALGVVLWIASAIVQGVNLHLTNAELEVEKKKKEIRDVD